MRHLSILATATLLGLTAASAETTTVTLLCPFDPQNLVGSVIGSSGSVTTYSVGCVPGTDSNDCGVPTGGVTIAEGPATATFQFTDNSEPTTVQCSLAGTTKADCIQSAGGSTTEAILTGSDLYLAFQPVVITAGDAAATGSAGTAATTTAANSAGTSTTPIASSTAASAGRSSGGASITASTASPSATHTNAAPIMGGSSMMHRGVIVVGVVAVAFL